jgi:trehalose 6-phosphate phosphatase
MPQPRARLCRRPRPAGTLFDTVSGVQSSPLPDPPPSLARHHALFLDFDGTLAPIAPRPDEVKLPSWVVPTLRALREPLDGALVIVSGRPLAELDSFLSPLRLPAAGVHGIERRLADGRIRVHAGPPPPEVAEAAQALVARHPGLLIERKPGALALHYRQRPELEALCLETIDAAVAGSPEWQALRGKCVVEVKPRRISKGAALKAFLAEPGFAGRTPVFVGDDATDEDGMREAQAAGGCGVKVGEGETLARHRLPDVAAVARWLARSAEAMAGVAPARGAA